MTHSIIEDLNWRYATKKFDPSAKLSTEQLHILMESMRLSASSYGLQAFQVLVVESSDIREQLMEASYGQRPVIDASHLFVFCANTKVDSSEVNAYMQRISDVRETPLEVLSPFANGILSSLEHKSQNEIETWTSKQAYIALGHLLQSCATLRIDALPMEGFNPKEYNKILNLDSQDLTAVLACPVGFRANEDQAQFKKKVRKTSEDFFTFV